MNEFPKVLVGVTTYQAKDYIFDNCMKHIAQLDYPKNRLDVVIVDNSKSPNYFYKLMRRGYKGLYRVERGANSREAITKAQNKIRKILLSSDYDYLLFIESDLLVPPDTLKRLLSYEKPVIGSTYIIGTGPVKVPCIFVDDIMKGGFRGTRPIGIRHNENGTKTYDKEEIENFFAKNKEFPIVQCHGMGFGCTLIKRQLLDDTVFWYDLRFDDKHSDVYFYLDMSRKQIPVYVDITTIVPHYPTDWAKVSDR
jgi:GT2 family glycosyltransferase